MTSWKEPPADRSKVWLNKSLELAINLTCNWTCIACDAFSQLRTTNIVRKGTMTLEQIWHFIGEMHQRNAYFGRIRILGGEPTIAPRFLEIVKLLREELVLKGYVGQLEVITNGTNPEKIEPAKQYLNRVRVSGEAAKQRAHTANLVHSPSTLGYVGKQCNAPGHCGWSLNYWGYYPCSSGAGLSRFHDWQRWQRLSLPVTLKETWPDLIDLCQHCYHALREDDKIKCGTGTLPGQAELNTPSPENQKLMDSWMAGREPSLPVYGQLTQVPESA